MNYPWIVDAREAGLRLVEDEEGCQVGSVRGDDDHGESSPDHSEDPCGEGPRRALADTRVQQHPPRKPDGGGQVQ